MRKRERERERSKICSNPGDLKDTILGEHRGCFSSQKKKEDERVEVRHTKITMLDSSSAATAPPLVPALFITHLMSCAKRSADSKRAPPAMPATLPTKVHEVCTNEAAPSVSGRERERAERHREREEESERRQREREEESERGKRERKRARERES